MLGARLGHPGRCRKVFPRGAGGSWQAWQLGEQPFPPWALTEASLPCALLCRHVCRHPLPCSCLCPPHPPLVAFLHFCSTVGMAFRPQLKAASSIRPLHHTVLPSRLFVFFPGVCVVVVALFTLLSTICIFIQCSCPGSGGSPICDQSCCSIRGRYFTCFE